MKKIISETKTDWLGTRPVFYNTKTGAVSHAMNEVTDFANLEIDPEGFNNYLDFGYSVFGQTPVKHVKFLEHSSVLRKYDDGTFEIEQLPDPVIGRIGTTSNEQGVLEGLASKIREWERSFEGEIVIPTSGGYDSRLLNLLVEDKERIRAFTYGISADQSRSFEVVYAQRLARALGIAWQQIPLSEFLKYTDEWIGMYGASMHAHGMYHMEFFNKVRPLAGPESRVLSGIIGDIWAGKMQVSDIRCPNDLTKLSYSHGLKSDSSMSLLKSAGALREVYFLAHRYQLQEPLWRVVESMRLKIMLLHYLVSLPQKYGFDAWSPFVDFDVATGMLCLPERLRKGRAWQKNFFNAREISFGRVFDIFSVDYSNVLDLQMIERWKFVPLDEALLREVISPEYIQRINAVLGRSSRTLAAKRRLFEATSFANLNLLLGKTGVNRYNLRTIEHQMYAAYLVLKPIEAALKKRNETHHG
jgi:hypothetical protein